MNAITGSRYRVLVIDDNAAIHDDLRKILSPDLCDEGMAEAEELLFGSAPARQVGFSLDSAYQGQDGLAMLVTALGEGKPYSLAFVDVRMPPGWDGIETVSHLWEHDPGLQVVICTAYTDYSWRDMVKKLGETHNFAVLKKPFDNIEVLQLAHALCFKRDAMEAARVRLAGIEAEVEQRRETEQRLTAALEAAQESDRCKRAFLATMGHELRTPLNAILGYSEMLEEDARVSGVNAMIEPLGKVQAAGRHLLGLINDILDMAKIESGKLSIHAQTVSARELANEVIAMAAPLAAINGNRLEAVLPEPDRRMEVDEGRFRQSLLNLLSNACKFTARGEITLTVWSEDPGWLNWTVRDTGIGIAAGQLPKLFQPFVQIDSAETRKFGGSGLGLAITRRLCELMGGSVTVSSQLGEGSEFTIRIPEASSGTGGNLGDLLGAPAGATLVGGN